MTDLSHMTYAELLDSLRKDLQPDATTDLLPGTVFAAAENDAGSHGTTSAADKQSFLHGLGLQWGSVPITWAASAAAAASITHGLGHVPTWFSLALVLSGQVAYLQATSISSTTIAVNGQAAAAVSLTGTVYWAAL